MKARDILRWLTAWRRSTRDDDRPGTDDQFQSWIEKERERRHDDDRD